MSWHFSRVTEAGFSALASSDSTLFAGSKLTPALETPCMPARTTDAYSPSQFGMTSAPSTADLGVASWISFLAASRASRSARPPGAETTPPISGRKCSASCGRFGRATSSQRTSSAARSQEPRPIYERRALAPSLLLSIRPSWLRRIAVSGGGWLPTPTAKANHDAPSMRKWPAYATYQDWLGGRTCPQTWEWMMGWPEGWTDSTASATDSFHSWLSRHGATP